MRGDRGQDPEVPSPGRLQLSTPFILSLCVSFQTFALFCSAHCGSLDPEPRAGDKGGTCRSVEGARARSSIQIQIKGPVFGS